MELKVTAAAHAAIDDIVSLVSSGRVTVYQFAIDLIHGAHLHIIKYVIVCHLLYLLLLCAYIFHKKYCFGVVLSFWEFMQFINLARP